MGKRGTLLGACGFVAGLACSVDRRLVSTPAPATASENRAVSDSGGATDARAADARAAGEPPASAGTVRAGESFAADAGTGGPPLPDALQPMPAALDAVFRLSFGDDGLGEVTLSAPGVAGQTCSDDCEIRIAAGTTVIAAAAAQPYSTFFGWSNPDCSGQRTCSVRVDAAADLSVNFRLAHNVAFTSSRSYAVNELPRPGQAANAECARLAASAGVHGTRWVAWLAAEGPTDATSDDVAPAQFLQSTGGWVRRDGVPLARSRNALFAGELLNPINLTETGAPAAAAAWSGANADGTLRRSLGAPDCNGWSSTADTTIGALNESGSVGNLWAGRSIAPCFASFPLQCFADDPGPELTIVPASGRVAFVSSGLFVPGGGITAADAQCQREACEAGLAPSADGCQADLGARVFHSYLHTPSQSAWQRFDLSRPGWVRPDGILWLSPASLLEGDAVGRLTGLNVSANGVVQVDGTPAWLGRTNGDDSCASWALGTGQGLVSDFSDALPGVPLLGEQPRGIDCSLEARLLCLEE